MAGKTVGELIKEARAKAGLTQEQLAVKIAGVSASDIGKAERGEKELTQAELKLVAKATGVTQKSLLEAASGGKAKSSKTASAKTTSSKTTSSKSTSSKSTSSKAAASKADTSKSVKLSQAEQKLITLYRKADAETKRAAEQLLSDGKNNGGLMNTILNAALDTLSGKQ